MAGHEWAWGGQAETVTEGMGDVSNVFGDRWHVKVGIS